MVEFDYENFHYDSIGNLYRMAIEEERWLWEANLYIYIKMPIM